MRSASCDLPRQPILSEQNLVKITKHGIGADLRSRKLPDVNFSSIASAQDD